MKIRGNNLCRMLTLTRGRSSSRIIYVQDCVSFIPRSSLCRALPETLLHRLPGASILPLSGLTWFRFSRCVRSWDTPYSPKTRHTGSCVSPFHVHRGDRFSWYQAPYSSHAHSAIKTASASLSSIGVRPRCFPASTIISSLLAFPIPVAHFFNVVV